MPYTLWQGVLRRLSDSRHGLAHRISSLSRALWEFLRDSTPSRRRQRWGDIDFDCDYRVDTTAARLDTRTRLLGTVAGGPYQPTDPALFHQMMGALAVDYCEFTFIDLGSGKGRALLMAADYPFRRIIGVELLDELNRIAQENIAKYRGPRQKCFAIELISGHALEFELPPEPLVLYIFNSFEEDDMSKMVASLEWSIKQHPRPVYVVYHNPIREHCLSTSPVLHRIAGTHQFSTYTNITK